MFTLIIHSGLFGETPYVLVIMFYYNSSQCLEMITIYSFVHQECKQPLSFWHNNFKMPISEANRLTGLKIWHNSCCDTTINCLRLKLCVYNQLQPRRSEWLAASLHVCHLKTIHPPLSQEHNTNNRQRVNNVPLSRVWRGGGVWAEKRPRRWENKGKEMRERIAKTKLLFKPGGRENITINNSAV